MRYPAIFILTNCLKLIRPLLERGDSVDGNVNARLTVSGTATSPSYCTRKFKNVTELKARSVTMPFDITGGNLAMNFHGATSTLSGKLQTRTVKNCVEVCGLRDSKCVENTGSRLLTVSKWIFLISQKWQLARIFK